MKGTERQTKPYLRHHKYKPSHKFLEPQKKEDVFVGLSLVGRVLCVPSKSILHALVQQNEVATHVGHKVRVYACENVAYILRQPSAKPRHDRRRRRSDFLLLG